MSRSQKDIETESRLVLVRSWGSNCYIHGISFEDDKNVLELVMMVAQLCEYIPYIKSDTLKGLILCELHSNEETIHTRVRQEELFKKIL